MQPSYHRPATLSDVLSHLAEGPATIAAGCTDLYPATQAKSLTGPVLDITAIPELRGIRQTAEGWSIGACTTWSDVIAADLPPAFLGLQQAAREVGSVQIQNAGTVAGNLCTASPAGDGIPCLLTLDASVSLSSVRGNRSMPLDRFLIGPRKTALEMGELVTEITIPGASGIGQGGFLKLGARKYLVISIVMAAARVVLTDGVVSNLSVALGACSPTAQRLATLEQAALGVAPHDLARLATTDKIAPHLAPIDDIRADAAYRVDAATEITRRLLASLADAPTQEAA